MLPGTQPFSGLKAEYSVIPNLIGALHPSLMKLALEKFSAIIKLLCIDPLNGLPPYGGREAEEVRLKVKVSC